MHQTQEARAGGVRRWRDHDAIRHEADSVMQSWRQGKVSTSETLKRLILLHDEAQELAKSGFDFGVVAELKVLARQLCRWHEREFGPDLGGRLALRYLAWKHSRAAQLSSTKELLECEMALGRWDVLTSWHRERVAEQIESITR